MIYLADHPALAVLEVRVHLDLPFELLPGDYVLIRVVLPDMPATEATSMPRDPAAFGDAWLATGDTALLRVPSALVPRARNLLVNPRHPGAQAAEVAEVIPFTFDARLWAIG